MAALMIGGLATAGSADAQKSRPPASTAERPNAISLRYPTRRGEPLTILTPADPQFDKEMEDRFPDFLNSTAYDGSRPFLVILRNDTQRTVRAYEIVWHLQEPDADSASGYRERELRTFAITTPLELRNPGGLRGMDKSIPPGGERVVSPVFNGVSSDSDKFTFFNDPEKLPQKGTYTSITPDLDCVVYGDGSFSGPNHSQLLLRYNVVRDAQHDEALSVLRMLRANPKNPQLKLALVTRQAIGADDTHPNNRALPLYLHARGRAAQEFDVMLESGGYERVHKVAEQLVKLMPPHEAFTSLGGAYHQADFEIDGKKVSPLA